VYLLSWKVALWLILITHWVCDILSADELKLYDAACERELTPDCRRWLEYGGNLDDQ
jgi:hypothetical protein